MHRLHFKDGLLRQFINKAQERLEMNAEELGRALGISGRTINDWKREKYKPDSRIIKKLSELCSLPIPEHKILNKYWGVVKAAKLGGKKRYELYGPFGDKFTRAKGGSMSWIKRKNDPELLKKYLNTFSKPKESKEFAEFIGIMLGDGGMTDGQITVYLSSITDREYSKYVSRLMKKLFGLSASINEKKKDHLLRVGISGVNVVKYLVEKGLRVGNKVLLQVGVPEWIWNNEEYVKACIRGLIDTDGCFTIHRYKVKGKEYQYPKISFSNHSEPILDFVQKGLLSLGYNPKRTIKYDVWLHNQNEAKKYLKDIGVNNIKPVVKEILNGGVR